MDAAAVRSAPVLEIEHLLPYPVSVLFNWLVQTLLLEDAPLHFVEQLLFGESPSLSPELLVALLPLRQARVALAGQEVDVLLEGLVVEVVVLDLLQETHEGLLEVVPALLDVNQGPTHYQKLELLEGLLYYQSQLPILLHQLYLL